MIIHGSKSKLERPRYHENRDNTLIDASLTSLSYNFWSDNWIFKFHIFLKTGNQDLSRGVKINPIQDHLEVVALEPPPHNPCCVYKRPQTPSKPKKKKWDFLGPTLCLDEFWTFLLSSKHTHTKHIKGTWFSLHQKYKVLFLYPIFISLVLHLGFGVYGCGCSFLATIHTPNFLNLFLLFILLFLP